MTDAFMLDAPAGKTKPERRPGDFDRDANGTPWVSHPDGERTKPKRKGDEGTIKRVRYSRPSGFGDQILNSYNLTKWNERNIVAGFAIGLGSAANPLLDDLLPVDTEAPDWRAKADHIVKRAKDVAKAMLAADRGTHAHQLTEAVDTERDYIAQIEGGEQLGIPEAAQHALVASWKKMLDRYGLEILATELAVVNDRYRCAGTLDRIVRLTRDLTFVLPGGELVALKAGTVLVLDLKTGKLRHDNGEVSWWGNYPIQVAIYAGGVGYNCDTEERYDLPWAVDQRWAIIAHLDVLGAIAGDDVPACELILVDLELGRRGADLVAAAKEYEKADTKFSLVGTCNVVGALPDPHKHGNDFHAVEPAPPRTAPDEGRTGVNVDSLRDKYKALDPYAKTWVEFLRHQAQLAGVDFHLSTPTERRAWIMSGLCSLANAEILDHDTVKAIARHVTGDDACEWPAVTAGHAVGTLDAVQAKAFRDLALVFASGMGALEFDDLGAKVAA